MNLSYHSLALGHQVRAPIVHKLQMFISIKGDVDDFGGNFFSVEAHIGGRRSEWAVRKCKI